MAGKKPDDPDSDDPFFGDDEPPRERETINAFEIDDHSRWLRAHGYEPGDSITLTWHDADGTTKETSLDLPRRDWDDEKSWHRFYDEMRDFYEDIWGTEDGTSGAGSALAG